MGSSMSLTQRITHPKDSLYLFPLKNRVTLEKKRPFEPIKHKVKGLPTKR
jgi:hypothetical protein